ncbi:polycystic kidney disease protein 1-like 2 [Penaeus chinensis]|uniref:polycystic kidney disease protein 1-like 2 n=1 Tax=Penaeus chinensis TaxID=139456 RepID=UPI001FB61EF2|nr:polycystic kidney disease protein 1-like 2 [Penaeus chinensis]
MEEVHESAGNGYPLEYNVQEVPAPWDAYGKEGGGCFAKGPGTLLLGNSINLKMATFSHPETIYEVKVKVAKDTRVAYAAVAIEVMTYPPPTVSIRCVDPASCVPYQDGVLINPSNRLALLGECLDMCQENMTYSWEVFDDLAQPVNEVDTLCDPAEDCGPVFITPKTEKDLAIGSRFFAINPNIGRFRLKLTMGTPAKIFGYSQSLIILNQAPLGGVCTISGQYGKALVDTFPTSCDNWRDAENAGIASYVFYTYQMKSTGQVKNTIAAAALKSIDIIFPVGYFEVRCEIWDTFNAYTDVHIGYVNITMPTEEEVLMYNTSDKMDYLSAVGDQTTLGMVLVASSSIRENADWLSLDESSMGNLTEDEQLSRLRDITGMNKGSLDLALESMSFATLSQINVGAGIMESSVSGIFSTDLAAYTVDLETRESALSLLDKMTNTLDEVTVASPYDLQPFLTASMNTMSALMTGLNKIIENPEKVCPTDQDAAGDWDYNVDLGDDLMMDVPLDREAQLKQNVYDTTRLKAKQQVDKMMGLVDKISEKVNEKCVVGETVKAKSESGASIVVSKLTEEVLWRGMLVDPGDEFNASVKFPELFCPSRYNTPNTRCKEEFSMTVVVWPCITHVFPVSKELLTNHTKVISIDIAIRNEKINVKNETNPIILEIPRDPQTLPEPLLVNTKDVINAHLPIVYHSFNITRESSAFTIDVFPVDSVPSQMVLMIGYERMPTPSNYSSIHKIKDFPVGENNSYTLFVNTKDNKNRVGRFFLGMALLKAGVDISSNSTERPLTKEDLVDDFDMSYRLRVYTSGCYYFDEISEEWSGVGLNVLSATPRITTCETRHLTPFGSGHFPAPNTVDFEYIFANVGFKDNLTLYMVLIITFVCYVIMMIWARFMDKKDIEHRGVLPLEDNLSQDKYLYEITITTGPDKEAGTNSNIQFMVSGEYAETEVRILPESDGNRFHRYSVDAFVMSTPGPLGHISYLRIWHDNSGNSPFDCWQLQSVVIRDLQTRKKFVFHVNDWLALDRGKMTVDLLLSPSESEEGKSFTEDFYVKGHRNANEGHIWMSIFLRPTGSRFSRKERVTVCAFFLYVSMLLNAVWYKSQAESPRTGLFNFGPITVSVEQTVTGIFTAIAVFPVVMLFIFIFKRARPYKLQKCRALEAFAKSRKQALEKDGLPVNHDDGPITTYDSDSVDSKNPSKDPSPVKCLPWWMRLVAWILLLGLIAVSVFFVWSYGIMWGEIKTVKWCSSFITSFFISLLMSQWIKVLIMTTIGAACCKKMDNITEDIDCDEELPALKIDEEWKKPKPLDSSMSRKVHRVGGVDPKEPDVAALTTRLTKEREMSFVIRDIGAYCLFLLLLYVLVSGRTDENAFLLQDHLRNAFIKEGHLEFDFSSKIVTADHFWYWSQNVILKELRAQRWYNDEPPYGLRGFLGDRNNRIMGYAILRQVRSDPTRCKVVKPMDGVVKSCSGSRGILDEDYRDYCAHWRVNATFSGACQYPEFHYKTAGELQTYPMVGYLGTYGGGGYVVRLKGAESDIIDRLYLLQKLDWIDKSTRAVMLEFSTFNANINLFATASVIAEFNEGGGIVPKWRFEPIRLLPKTGAAGYIVTLSEIIFVVCTVIFTLKELWKIKKQKCLYFTSYWNIAEICILVTSYATVGVYVYRFLLTQEALDIFEETYGNGYIRLDSAALMDQFYLYLVAIICFFSTLKLIKLLQFNKRMDVLALTIRLCWDELSIFFVAFGIIFFAFSCLFYFMFLMQLQEFARFIAAVETCFKMMLGKFNFEAMNIANPMSPILFFAFSVINSMILINIMLTIILKAFNDVKVDLEKRENKYDVIDFVWSSVRRALRVEERPPHHVTPDVEAKASTIKSQPTYGDSDELPDKVSQLMKYIGDTYFDGRLDLNDSMALKQMMGGRMRTAKRPNSKKNVLSSD